MAAGGMLFFACPGLECARGKFMEGPRPGLSGDGLVEAAGKLALASGRCRRGCDAAILCAPPLAACQFFCGTGYAILSIF
ncbi:hypothetical protein M431DRAFT_502828 [Trichoderma harzianum CBS 226.95]|uniref:Uncharacterized protein n=1 Tax=Trichoderma harzianum CBS 226.95 TaxID=983964 RepID=A0A2T4AUC9_TRIHA|nr:hypothetical protein M431DRAFT_502828 [Trichoderma harzianum CBS 226.95]PTB60677.1 hypothetical protein M431DRAFT_502828 [Trichoderma harzianum CBS 226.95]